MSETLAPQQPEDFHSPEQVETTVTPPAVEVFDNFTNPEAFAEREKMLKDKISDPNSAVGHAGRLIESSRRLHSEANDAYNAKDWDREARLKRLSESALKQAAQMFGEDAIIEYKVSKEELESIQSNYQIVMLHGSEATRLAETLLSNLTEIDDGVSHRDLVPPAKMKDGDRDANYHQYLSRKYFVDPDVLEASVVKGPSITLHDQQGLQLPLSNFISAQEFDSWEGRGRNGTKTKSPGEAHGTDSLPSRELIMP